MDKSQLLPDQQKIIELLLLLQAEPKLTEKKYLQIVKKIPNEAGQIFKKSDLILGYQKWAGQFGLREYDPQLVSQIRMKPTRTLSGVVPVTVLTKPFPCPGQCIFCPSDVRMPKSYLRDEPGAQRAEKNRFDPYLQVYSRLEALDQIGHGTDKVELIILGGTWSFYPESYQIWYIKECFRALNDFKVRDGRSEIEDRYQYLDESLQAADEHKLDGEQLDKRYNQVIQELYTRPEKLLQAGDWQSATWEELEAEQHKNETAKARSVGLVIETRPDYISEAEVIRVRRLGCTKTQIGVQSLQDEVLKKNKRGHKVEATARAFKLLRQAGFKIHAHWMANLYGSNVELDKQDYLELFSDERFKPDELKIYPCSLISSAELMEYYQRGEWQPYNHQQLLEVLSFALAHTPRYCRLTRVIRDIPSTDIVVGNKKTNFREIATRELDRIGQKSEDIRSREVRGTKFDQSEIKMRVTEYQTTVATENFIEFVVKPGTDQEKLLGFLRLSLPKEPSFIEELQDSAIIREIHVYGQVVGIDQNSQHRPQHLGLGTKLIARAKEIALEAGYKKLNVISAIGTKEYYRKKGFSDGQLYQYLEL